MDTKNHTVNTAENQLKPQKKAKDDSKSEQKKRPEREIGGFENAPEPTRYGDWEVKGRCSDF